MTDFTLTHRSENGDDVEVLRHLIYTWFNDDASISTVRDAADMIQNGRGWSMADDGTWRNGRWKFTVRLVSVTGGPMYGRESARQATELVRAAMR